MIVKKIEKKILTICSSNIGQIIENMKKNAEINIKVNPLGPSFSKSKIKSNIKQDTMDFIDSLSYNGFILAGNSVANMIENIDIKGDLDFWVLNRNKYLDILHEFKEKDPIMYNIYPSMIEIIFRDLPIINLILSNMTAEDTTNSFDFDYCRCYYTRQTGCMASEICLNSIFTKTINHEIAYGDIRLNRIMKAIKYGYSFSYNFWRYNPSLLGDRNKLCCHICRVSRENYAKTMYDGCDHFINKKLSIGPDDLNLTAFQQTTFDINITDPANVDDTMDELKKIFYEFYMMPKNTFKLPKLFSIRPKKFDLVKMYVDKIIIFNPVHDGNYLQIKFSHKKLCNFPNYPSKEVYLYTNNDDDSDDKPSKKIKKLPKFDNDSDNDSDDKPSKKIKKLPKFDNDSDNDSDDKPSKKTKKSSKIKNDERM